MMSPRTLFRAMLSLSWLALAVLCSPAALGQYGRAESDVPPDLRERLLEHRQAEAEAKARAAEGRVRRAAAMTPNQDAYDVTYYELDLDFTVAPSIYQLTGRVGTRMRVTGDSLTTVELDLADNITVFSTTAGGLPAAFTHAQDLLTVTLDRTYLTGETVDVEVQYAGNPSGPAFGWDAFGGESMIWTLSEPYGARTWWPCKDVNTDKADSLDIRITVASNLIAVSQGVLKSNINNGSTRTYHWRTDYPTNTYQVSLAIHPYTAYSDWYVPLGGGLPMEVQFYVFPDHYDDVQANFAKTVPMMEAFAGVFGEYPFLDEKYGHAEFLGGAGMEHQTISSLGIWTEDVIAHELVHQWFGNYVTCADFTHAWLNEGFATWGEAYWQELAQGPEAYLAYMEAASHYEGGTIYVEDPVDFQTIFNAGLTYNKGAWVVHMLRGVLGDADFFAGLNAYQAQYAYGSATTEQLRDVLETVSGQDLDTFFDQWIYGEYHPCYAKEWTQLYSQDASTLQLTVEQVHANTGPFAMPVQVRVTTDVDTVDFQVDNSLAQETYYLPVNGTVKNVELDPDRWILRRIQDKITAPTFAEGVLLVNGVSWAYQSELTAAYDDSAFTGYGPFTFWDVFPEPAGGYPASLPAPAGHGRVPAEVLGEYSTVIWVSDSYQGDVVQWFDTSIYPYLMAGGNVILMTRRAHSFFDDDLTNYLGVAWTHKASTLQDYSADYPGLLDMDFQGTQTWNDLFSVYVGPNSTVLFKDNMINSGVGLHTVPPGGGQVNANGGHFVLLSGRPYRMNTAQLRDNIQVILEDVIGDAPTVAAEVPPVTPGLRLLPSYPNPFTATTAIPFAMSRSGEVDLAVFDTAGRQVRTLLAGELPAGRQEAVWDGTDRRGQAVASGIYYIRLRAQGETLVRKLVRTR